MRAFAVLVLFLTVATHAADTAYSALRVIGSQRGEDYLRHVMQLRGSEGTWKVLLADSRARTGLREVHVRNGRIIRDATVAEPRGVTTPLNLGALNLDSDGALITAIQHASPAFTADRVDYTLTNGSAKNAPVWTLKTREGSGTSLQIAADTGEIIAQPEVPDNAPYAIANDGIEFSEDRDVAIANQSPRKRRASPPSRPRVPDVPETVESVVDHVERGARRLKRFLPF